MIGAMLISPLMGPISSLGFGFASLDGHQIRAALRVVLVGAVIGILTGVLLTWLSPIRNATPEIIARTQPTLLDLAIAILSGMAGAYATVQQKGGTAIGVAIATALMPPLATVGYGLGVMNIAFAGGAFLLFVTNLAAIAFSFALVARLSGAARPLSHVEITPRYVVGGVLAFLVLATPLALTLLRVTHESSAQATARRIIADELKVPTTNIAQLQTTWPLTGDLSIDAVVVSPNYRNDGEQKITDRITKALGKAPQLNLQQVVAADINGQTKAIVDAAVERTASGIARDVPPLTAIRQTIGLPAQAIWVNRAERTVNIVPMAAPGWELGDYHALEGKAAKSAAGWQIAVVPPVVASLIFPVRVGNEDPEVNRIWRDNLWAILRWQAQNLTLKSIYSDSTTDENRASADENTVAVMATLKDLGVASQIVQSDDSEIFKSAKATGELKNIRGTEVKIIPAPPNGETILN
ncbi:MAG: DUF389 domain-containing protein [Sphingobium sp.]